MEQLIRKEIYKTLFKFLPVDNNLNFDYLEIQISRTFKLDFDKYLKIINIDAFSIEILPNDLLGILYYRIANYIFYQTQYSYEAQLISDFGNQQTKIFIHSQTKIGDGFAILNGAYTKIFGGTLGNNIIIIGRTIIGNNNLINELNPIVSDNVIIENNAVILGKINIGENSHILSNVVIKEDIPSGSKVEIINQYQTCDSKVKNIIPSQQLFVYGIVPKFKNSIIIMGEGFYNPTVLIKFKKEINFDYQITYWDKNKIIIKIKNPIPIPLSEIIDHKIIILSNSNKLVLINNFGLIKACQTLTKN